MQRAHPVDMRKALEVVHGLKQAGILFVPMPVLNNEDHQVQLAEMMRRLEKIEQEAEREG